MPVTSAVLLPDVRESEKADFLTPPDAARYLGIHEETVRRLAREGKLPGFKVGGVWRFSRKTLHQWSTSQGKVMIEKRILVIDDDEAVRETVERAIGAAGYEAVSAGSGGEVHDLFMEDVPDLVLLDLVLPDTRGAELMREIRARWPGTPVIIITGYADTDLVQQVLPYGPLLVLGKPIDRRQLLEAVRLVLGKD